ncbi:hypothetical protein [Caldalkalibacillus mannanilyticus]|uniref:hypothetical protein n=1 Tax=Caldalkalibacillus mannanilyticus TaxID=1418 RepID=UPI00046AAFF5|nr:hypothetical protein [Caldalkalibacillus mannanilyticus]
MTKIYVFVILIILLFSGCTQNEGLKEQQTIGERDEQQNELTLVGKESIDWDGSGIKEEVEVSYYNAETLHLIIKTKEQEQIFIMPQVAFPEQVTTLSLDASQSGIAIQINYYEPEATIQNKVDERWAYLILGRQKGEIIPLLNSLEHLDHQNQNYEIVYYRDGKCAVIDHSSMVEIEFMIPFDDEYKSLFHHLMNESESITKYESADWYMDIKIEEKENKPIIKFSKMIPGIQRNDPLGYFQYDYTWKNDHFVLSKEAFFTAKGVFFLDPVEIKQVSFD